MIKLIENLVGKKAKKQYALRLETDPEFAELDCEKVFRDFGWRSQNSLFEALSRVITSKMVRKQFD